MSHTHASTRPAMSPFSVRRTAFWSASLLLAGAAVLGAGQARAQGAEIFKDADLALGEKLIAEHKCAECHARQVGGDGSAIFRPKGRINTAGLLRGMVELCNTQMNLGLFPEDVTAVAAVLNRDHYKFK
ncbi:MAG: hypothetical protein R3E94_06795 [Burkholderiaceae bacterium]